MGLSSLGNAVHVYSAMPSGKSGNTGSVANWSTMSAQLPVKPRQSAGAAQLPPSGPLSRMATISAQQLTACALCTRQPEIAQSDTSLNFLSVEHPYVDQQLAYDERDKDHEHLPPLQAVKRLVCGQHRQQRRQTRARKRTARAASRRTSDKKVRNVSFCGVQHGSA